ncbi:hypothetical protein MSG28_004941 [Choristoneura fumiferana]|uniref:Uncharacterized protein n=1 Tax=Choristoneura fumiferana TaxID=7141 RepID=A0ACC0JP93_CHOFU|nr:hypothetical protein MSG28_004941 [Choristoneura fumiferana]
MSNENSLSSAKADLQIGSGIPLPHANELENMIRIHIFPNKTDDETYIEYFENRDMDIDNDTMILLENLDFSVLDADGVRNILKLVNKQEMENASVLVPQRRKMHRVQYPLYEEECALFDNKAKRAINKTIDLMHQSIYATRYMIERTKPIRKMYRSEFVYQMGVMYGYLLELRFKSDNCLGTMSRLNFWHFKFSRFLYLYERLLTIHVDFTNSLERMFLLQAEIHKPTTPVITTTASSEETT